MAHPYPSTATQRRHPSQIGHVGFPKIHHRYPPWPVFDSTGLWKYVCRVFSITEQQITARERKEVEFDKGKKTRLK